jgi:hypothetical protein
MALHTYNLLDEELHVTTNKRIDMWFNFDSTEQFQLLQSLLEMLSGLGVDVNKSVVNGK